MARKAGISLRTIAEATGVSVVTVSRALNRDFLVDPDTAKRIQKAADKLGYKLPAQERRSVRVSKGNVSDRPLRTGRLAFMIPDQVPDGLETPLSQGLQKGMRDYLFERKIELASTYLDNGKRLPEALARKEVDGFILRGNFSEISDALSKPQAAQMGRFPHVSIFGVPPIHRPKLTSAAAEDYILPDDRLVGRSAADALIQHGTENLLLLSTLPPNNSKVASIATFSRRNGFIYEAFCRGVDYTHLEVQTTDTSQIIKALKKHIKQYGSPKGVFLTWPFPEVMKALNEVGLSGLHGVPLYCAVSGPQDPSESQGATGINIRPEALGRAAAELLLWRINHPELESKSILIPPQPLITD